jgi:hypothetical protein
MGGVGGVFDGRLMGCSDIGSAATTSGVADGENVWSTWIECELGENNALSIMAGAVEFTFILVECLSDAAIS